MATKEQLLPFVGKTIWATCEGLKCVEDIDDIRNYLLKKYGADNVTEFDTTFKVKDRVIPKPWVPRDRVAVFGLTGDVYYLTIQESSAVGKFNPRRSFYPISKLEVIDDKTLLVVVNASLGQFIRYTVQPEQGLITMKLPNGMTLDIAINENLIPLDKFAPPQIQIDESDQFGIPILNMRLVDQTGGTVLKTFTPFPDGALISITLTQSEVTVTREFRCSASSTEGGTAIVRGYLNHPKYVTATTKGVRKGTSKAVLESIATECGFAFNSPQTADEMLWQPVNQRLINFARHILEGAYISDESMITGRITVDGEMRVRNLAVPQPSKGLFGYTAGAIPIYGFQPEPSSQANLHGGYKQVIVRNLADGTLERLEDMPLTVTEMSLNRNPKVAGLNTNGSVKHLPKVHPMNEHPNMARAMYNNNRADTLFSMKSKILINNVMTNLCGLDYVTVANESKVDGTAGNNLVAVYNGDWVVSSKAIFVENGQYFEMFKLMRMGLNVDMHSNTV